MMSLVPKQKNKRAQRQKSGPKGRKGGLPAPQGSPRHQQQQHRPAVDPNRHPAMYPRDYEDDDGAEGFDVRPIASRGAPLGGGGGGVGPSGEPMPPAWAGHDGGGGSGAGYYHHYDSRRSTGLVAGGPAGASAGEDDRFHAYPSKYRRTAGAGWATRHPHSHGSGGGGGGTRPIGGDPPRYLESPPMAGQAGDVAERDPPDNAIKSNGPGPRSPPSGQWRSGGGGGDQAQWRAVSPSNVSRADINAPPGSAAQAPKAESAAGASPPAKAYDGGGPQNNPAWKPAVGWQARRPTPTRESAAQEDPGSREEGAGGGEGARAAAAVHPSSSPRASPPSSYPARNGGGGGGSNAGEQEGRDHAAAAAARPSRSPSDGPHRRQQQQQQRGAAETEAVTRGEHHGDGRPGAGIGGRTAAAGLGGAVKVLPSIPSGRGPPPRYAEDPADHHPHHQYNQQAYDAELAERYRQGGRKARFGNGGRTGANAAAAAAAAAAARGIRPSSVGGAWQVSAGPPHGPPHGGAGWREPEYWGGPGYHAWGGAMMPEQHGLGSPPVSVSVRWFFGGVV